MFTVSMPYRKLGWKYDMNIFLLDSGLTPCIAFLVDCWSIFGNPVVSNHLRLLAGGLRYTNVGV